MKGKSVPSRRGRHSGPLTIERLAQKDCGREEYFLLLARLLRERLPGAAVEFVGETVLLVTGVGVTAFTLSLNDPWLEYSTSDDRRESVEGFVRFAVSVGHPVPATREAIIAVIKCSPDASVSLPGNRSMIEHLCGDLWIRYGVLHADGTRELTGDDMDGIGLDKESLRPLAAENLKKLLAGIEPYTRGPCRLLIGSDHIAGFLLLDEFWDQAANSVDGKLVATVPVRNMLMYTGSNSNSDDGIAFIKARSEELAGGWAYPISDVLIVREDGSWKLFDAE